MAVTKNTEKEKSKKLTPFEQELIDTIKKINEFKIACEANIACSVYKNPDMIFELNLSLEEFHNNIWKVYWTIANDIVTIEKKNILDDVTIGLYLEKHPKLRSKYEEYGGYDTIVNTVNTSENDISPTISSGSFVKNATGGNRTHIAGVGVLCSIR